MPTTATPARLTACNLCSRLRHPGQLNELRICTLCRLDLAGTGTVTPVRFFTLTDLGILLTSLDDA